MMPADNFIASINGYFILKGHHGEYRVVCAPLVRFPESHKLFETFNEAIKYCKKKDGSY